MRTQIGTADVVVIIKFADGRATVVPQWEPEPMPLEHYVNLGIEIGLADNRCEFVVNVRVNNRAAIAE